MLGFLLNALMISLTTLWTKTSTSSSDSAILYTLKRHMGKKVALLRKPGEVIDRRWVLYEESLIVFLYLLLSFLHPDFFLICFGRINGGAKPSGMDIWEINIKTKLELQAVMNGGQAPLRDSNPTHCRAHRSWPQRMPVTGKSEDTGQRLSHGICCNGKCTGSAKGWMCAYLDLFNKPRLHWLVMTTFKIWPQDWPYIIIIHQILQKSA